MSLEQLRLPDFQPLSGGPVAVVMMLKDTHTDNPKMLISRRLRSGMFGLPGGKLWKGERRYPARGAIRETRAETGIHIFSGEFLIESAISPIRIAAEGKERDMHVFYCFAEECATDIRPMRKEPDKHGPWRYYPVRLLPNLVSTGLMHPIAVWADLMGVIDSVTGIPKRPGRYDAWRRRDREIEREMESGRYGFLDYIHDKEDGHLVF